MAPVVESSASAAGSSPASCVLRCAPERLSAQNTPARRQVENDAVRDAARRIGTMAMLTAVTVVGVAVLEDVLQPELAAAHQAYLFRLSALCLVLASVGLAALERS